MAKLLLFTNTESGEEYVVILIEGSAEKHREPGFELLKEIEIGDSLNFTQFPCGRILKPE